MAAEFDPSKPLFEERKREDSSEARADEPTWEFLERVADPGIDRVRQLLNRWYSRYPIEERKGLAQRVRSGDDVEFHAAWFELYLYELHHQLDFEIEIEPELPGVGTRPDFHMTRDRTSLILEATILGNRDDAGRQARIDRIIAAVNRTQTPDFSLFFEIEDEGHDPPAMRDVRRKLERWLDGLDWETERAKQEAGFDMEVMPTRMERVGNWVFSFRAWARAPDNRGIRAPAISAGPSDGGTFAHGASLLSRLEEKAGKYGDPPVPVVIAVRLDRMAIDAHDVEVALIGPTIGRLERGAHRVVDTGRRGTGLFRHESGRWRNQHVAGVLVWNEELRPWSVARAIPTLWLHPEPATQLPEDLPWRRVHLDWRTGTRVAAGPFDPAHVFDLPEAEALAERSLWPGAFEFGKG